MLLGIYARPGVKLGGLPGLAVFHPGFRVLVQRYFPIDACWFLNFLFTLGFMNFVFTHRGVRAYHQFFEFFLQTSTNI